MVELAAGAVFAGHRIEAVAGHGGMGVVYRATHLSLDRTVALKVIAPALVEDDATRQRFLRESKLAASIDHPNVIPVYYTGEEDGIAYIAMRYVDGRDLRSLVREHGRLDPARAAHIIAQVGAALDAAHATGLVHRDVKPANVLLAAADHVYLSDFGLSKHALSMGGETRSGHWVGTLDYVAPEQIRGERLDARADVYALGGVLYFALTGRTPYPHEGDEAKLWAQLTEPPPRARDVVPDLPPGLDAVIARALAKRPDDRYPSAGDLGRAAVAAAGHREVRGRERAVAVGAAAPDETPTESGPAPYAARPRRRPRRGVLAAGLAALVAAAVAGVALSTAGGDTPAPARTPAPRPVAPHEVAAVHVGGRPNSLAVGYGVVAATNYRYQRLTLIDERTGRLRNPRPRIGIGGRDVEMGFGAAWVAVARQKAVFRIDPATGRKLARIALPRSPQAVAVGKDAVWAGLSTLEPAVPDSLVRIDPSTNQVTNTYPMPEGVRTLVWTPRGLWIVHRSAAALSHFDAATGKITRRVAIGGSPLGAAAYGSGAVWVTIPLEDTVVSIPDAGGTRVAVGVGRRPTGIAAAGDQIWVPSYIDHTLMRIDPKKSRTVGSPIPVRLNPYALALTRDSVWFTALGRGVIARIRMR